MRTRVRVGVLIYPRLPFRIGEDSGFLGSVEMMEFVDQDLGFELGFELGL